MKYQILVSHYNEDKQMVKRFFESLNEQSVNNFEVLLCSDGGKYKLDLKELSVYNFPITYAYSIHLGLTFNRNILLNKSNADYIMFCDIDDVFCDPKGLENIFGLAEKTNADIIGSNYYVEHIINNKYSYHLFEYDGLRVHGKLFKRNYLIQNEIAFPELKEIDICGDLAFLWLAFALSNNTVWIKSPFYIWKYNQNSKTRKEPYYHYKRYEATLIPYVILLKNFKKRKRIDLFEKLLSNLFAMIYIDITSNKLWVKTPVEYKSHALSIAKNYLIPYFNEYVLINEKVRISQFNLMFNYINREKPSYEDFKNLISTIKKTFIDL